MTGEIRIYVEGGGDGSQTKAQLRQGFSALFRSLVDAARSQRIRWALVVSGSRNNCFDDFCRALESHPNAFNVLLVDSESMVTKALDQHLLERDQWAMPVSIDHCHLMVQTMEAWLVADRVALARYYGEGFLDSAIPCNLDVEQIAKDTLESALGRATRNTQRGRYRKIQHGAALLGLIEPRTVRNKARHCDRFFRTLENLM